MNFQVEKLDGPFGAAITGLDLREPMDEQTHAAVNKVFVDNVVLCFRDQHLEEPKDFFEAGKQLGEPMKQVVATYSHPEFDDIEVLTNRQTDERTNNTKPMTRGGTWHTDHSNMEQPPKATMLYAIAIPDTGGDTQFINMYMAYDALSDDMKKQLEGKRAFHSYLSSRAPRKLLERTEEEKAVSDGTWQPLVRLHPETNRKSLYFNQMRIEHVDGMEHEEGFAFMDKLYAHTYNPEFQYSHQWRLGDVLIWDDRASLHQATSNYDQSQLRYMHRMMLIGEKPVLA